MNRRGFFSAIAGLAASPLAAALPAIPLRHVPYSLGVLPMPFKTPSPALFALAESMRETKERVAANVFANSFRSQVEPGLSKVFEDAYANPDEMSR